ncbi:uncharacterized protein SOCE26_049580 [Sorangium cellulosum]|uniref:Uncharacterized protein n=2 Tax=Sorangium cellulosum TaxID=56 RepID=A0A2L0EW64_SORCE|nr:uncharacterized protein SOCE26_049580 [Sorangium cellulosum]
MNTPLPSGPVSHRSRALADAPSSSRMAPAFAGAPVSDRDELAALLSALLSLVQQRRDIWLPLSFGVLGFAPIASLALAIFGLAPLHITTVTVVIPSFITAVALGLWYPRYGRVAARGYLFAIAGVLMYDVTRAPFSLLGDWSDFVPNIGALLLHREEPHTALGYTWRWLGNGGGMGLAFVMVYPLVARRRDVVQSALVYGVAVWSCLVLTLLLAPRGEQILFELTPKNLASTLIGHLVFGGVIGLLMRSTGINVRPYAADRPRIAPLSRR